MNDCSILSLSSVNVASPRGPIVKPGERASHLGRSDRHVIIPKSKRKLIEISGNASPLRTIDACFSGPQPTARRKPNRRTPPGHRPGTAGARRDRPWWPSPAPLAVPLASQGEPAASAPVAPAYQSGPHQPAASPSTAHTATGRKPHSRRADHNAAPAPAVTVVPDQAAMVTRSRLAAGGRVVSATAPRTASATRPAKNPSRIPAGTITTRRMVSRRRRRPGCAPASAGRGPAASRSRS